MTVGSWGSVSVGDRILLDVNALLALGIPGHPKRGVVIAAIDSVDRWFTTALSELAFVRLASNRTVSPAAYEPWQVMEVLKSMRGHPTWGFLADDATLADPLIDITPLIGHNQVPDFHLVDLAARHGMRLATFDAKLLRSLAPADRRHVRVLTV